MGNFVDAPCEGFLDCCMKDQLLEIAESYNVAQKNVKSMVKLHLVEKGLLSKRDLVSQ